MYTEIRARLYEQYQDACTRIALLSVRDLAESVQAAFADATTVVMSDSDQGGHLVLDHVEDRAGQIIADRDHLEAAGIDEDSTAANLSTDDISYPVWKAYAPRDQSRVRYRLDIDAALTIPITAFSPRP
jgi:hypothetical protein